MPWPSRKASLDYGPVEQSDTSELEEGPAVSNTIVQTPRGLRIPWDLLRTGVLVCLATAGLWFLISTGRLRWSPPPAQCIEQTSWPTPITSDLHIKYHTETFNGSFFKNTVFRDDGGPGSKVDEAWASLGINYRPMIIPESDALKIGIRPDQVQVSEKYGGGFVTYVDGLHQLHCLDLLRQSLYYNYDFYKSQGRGSFVDNSTIFKAHVSHCVDIIRQQLMCTIDTGLIGEVWWTDSTLDKALPFVDFSTKHICRNFDDVRMWAEERQMPDYKELPKDYLVRPKAGYRVFNGIP